MSIVFVTDIDNTGKEIGKMNSLHHSMTQKGWKRPVLNKTKTMGFK